ncbi:TPA_asm: hypothetical protein GJJ62_10910 [Listeria monocytogenes]|uniref:Uncharacterized protein n=4 Tax=Listeria TaxID=1637 RepID=A0A5L0N960_LISMN|nr:MULTISPECIES: hypothetical protein [Listeria]EAE3706855.1 hypothetical protein [Listeria monocytogenes serotype 1/2b]EAG6272461.1 hypothetical protein [Listeria monocytogenes CFSAN003726]EAG6360583.1 hypothetical protein [Listeria monocytogenes CFSAN003729]EAG6369588.1 hypothetical protein [Listeria monocytogenes CFSAN003728]EEP3936564.1 hypothetical protein [Listeria monocytogenes serotype 7]EEW20239.1 predicted protein [Listeria monocytogenes FSL R2-503]EFG03492.1 predicted protein [Lis
MNKGGIGMFYKNVVSGAILTEKEYAELVKRDAENLWELLDEQEKEDFGSIDNYEKHLNEASTPDSDFILVNAQGEKYIHGEW